MTGWIVQIRTSDHEGERVRRWAVAHRDWSAATQIAQVAQGLDAAHRKADVRVISMRVRREAFAEELKGLSEGEARLAE